ncbi:unnamed protein product [Soboliphyme baturini]|uniref:Uncharacterized protein n=1 Tax=Soboliphyme baturini TaxID=241478 RepID=A0A183J7L5_9BILA|nr:unnamed protein product [Soboliphyme baturini]
MPPQSVGRFACVQILHFSGTRRLHNNNLLVPNSRRAYSEEDSGAKFHNRSFKTGVDRFEKNRPAEFAARFAEHNAIVPIRFATLPKRCRHTDIRYLRLGSSLCLCDDSATSSLLV